MYPPCCPTRACAVVHSQDRVVVPRLESSRLHPAHSHIGHFPQLLAPTLPRSSADLLAEHATQVILQSMVTSGYLAMGPDQVGESQIALSINGAFDEQRRLATIFSLRNGQRSLVKRSHSVMYETSPVHLIQFRRVPEPNRHFSGEISLMRAKPSRR